jgi:hypothetical protein
MRIVLDDLAKDLEIGRGETFLDGRTTELETKFLFFWPGQVVIEGVPATTVPLSTNEANETFIERFDEAFVPFVQINHELPHGFA